MHDERFFRKEWRGLAQRDLRRIGAICFAAAPYVLGTTLGHRIASTPCGYPKNRRQTRKRPCASGDLPR